MTVRWACTILANILIGCAVFGLRPKHLRWLYLSQTGVVVASVLEVWAWYQLPDLAYNHLWSACDLTCAWLEIGLACEMLWNVAQEYHPIADSLFASVLLVHLLLWWSEYRAWLDFLNNGAWIAEVREWANLAIFPAALFAVIVHRRRYCAEETQ